MSRSLYDELGVSRTASEEEIAKAFRRLAKTCHPDLHPGDKKAEEKFKRISAAYEILSDKTKRARYDRGEIDEQGRERAFAQGGFHPGAGAGGARFEFGGPGGINFEEILGDLFGGARRRAGRGGPFAGGFAGAGPFAGGFAGGTGEDVKVTTEVDFLTAARGGTRRVVLPDGSAVDLTIPAGTSEGTVLRLKGKGQPGPAGPGDALVEVKVAPHPLFRREGLDVVIDQLVPLAVAVKGGKVRVPTLDGEVALTVPPRTSSGKMLRLKGKGIKDPRTGRQGDQLVRVLIELPMERELLELIERWAEHRAA
ncbi:MAG: J domain-containing protein [Geminicoccaceae bacterium]|nr:J domain-containing protein [Geminicoccaceae bacterium]MCX8100293.1 J domain-containing protein [Geminicoccaceae bacterium]MDW8370323.1 J domain-containing protein [Geminicoccaceae bacterium]